MESIFESVLTALSSALMALQMTNLFLSFWPKLTAMLDLVVDPPLWLGSVHDSEWTVLLLTVHWMEAGGFECEVSHLKVTSSPWPASVGPSNLTKSGPTAMNNKSWLVGVKIENLFSWMWVTPPSMKWLESFFTQKFQCGRNNQSVIFLALEKSVEKSHFIMSRLTQNQ